MTLHVPDTAGVTPASRVAADSDAFAEQCERAWSEYRTWLCEELERRVGLVQGEPGEITRHALLPPGKMVRPILLLESAAAVGGRPDQALPAAVGVEYAHVASLVHDDIIDRDEIRRGRPSVQHRYGTEKAILIGDMLIVGAFDCLSSCAERGMPDARIVAALRLMCEFEEKAGKGVVLEVNLVGDASCEVSTYLEMIEAKTASLFRVACESGAVLGGGGRTEVESLGRFGTELGMAFQIVDDLLPFVSTSATAGKSALSDLRNRRPTLPVLLAYRAARRRERILVEKVLAGVVPPMVAYPLIRAVLRRTGAVDRALRMAEDHVDTARAALTALPDSPARRRLARVLDQVTHRVR
ncbi:geranylgeranyl diphosphate synthase type I [Lentzea atacamensis]|uniref:Geranylgeranyl diphosphate synthase type I n=1 Tax=Lentzea atacamensis TaxID=531938 RepID=A0ABX9EBA7_9PSEU|nr:polyprenyl synthetase family protein [Lentzea atacamensis]RAS67460.1 geranylgeranyl diphosphate synthase type I [Lentzea atacamensis]